MLILPNLILTITFNYKSPPARLKEEPMSKPNVEYLASLRKAMKEHGIDAVVITSTDPHQSENAPAHWRGREWLTGFASVNGTNGTVVVTADKALCWTDSRYFIQAEQQLAGTGFEMMPEDGPEAVDLNEESVLTPDDLFFKCRLSCFAESFDV